jgi:lipoprotein-releasing system ATP-binding protein
MNDLVIKCVDVSKSYNDGERKIQVLNGVNFSLASGESIAIMGASGSGKSSLLNVLGGLDKATSGNVYLQGKLLADFSEKELSRFRNQHLGFVYQMHHLLMEFSALENVAMPLWIRGINKKLAEKEAAVILEKVGLSHRLTHKPSALSGGERQRVAIARALVAQPSCVLMDEPTGNLDANTAESVWQMISELQQKLNTSFVVVTHDAKLAHKVGRVYQLSHGVLSLQAP